MKYIMCLLGLLITTLAYAQEEHEYQHADIDGNKIAFSCEGEGPNTVVLVHGMGLGAHKSFGNIYHNYKSQNYKICLYDRAGIGKSNFKNPRTRTIAELVDELHQLIKINRWKNIVLVAHSFGGFIARGYVDAHPSDIKAVLFADCVGMNWLDKVKSHMSSEGWQIMESTLEWEKNTHSREDYLEASLASSAYKFPDKLPISVLSRGLPHTILRRAKMSYDDVDVFNVMWDSAQYNLTTLSNNSRHVIMRYSDHFVDEKDPWLVLDEIYSLQKRVKR